MQFEETYHIKVSDNNIFGFKNADSGIHFTHKKQKKKLEWQFFLINKQNKIQYKVLILGENEKPNLENSLGRNTYKLTR